MRCWRHIHILPALAVVVVAQAGTLHMRDGRSMAGQLALEAGGIRVVTADGKAELVAIAQLKRARFDPPGVANAATNRPGQPAFTNAFTRGTLPMGVLTWSGAFLSGGVRAADDSVVSLVDAPGGISLTTANTAAIFFQPLTPCRANALRALRPGVLLATGDFVEGEFKSVELGKVRLTSVLFGGRSFEVGREAAAVILRKPALPLEQFEVRLTDGSALIARGLRAEGGALLLEDPFLRDLRLPAAQLDEITFGKATNRLALTLALWEAMPEPERQQLEQEEKLTAKIALDQGLRWRSRVELLDRVRFAAEKVAERSLALAGSERDRLAAEKFAAEAVAVHAQVVTTLAAKEKDYAELRRKADLGVAEARARAATLTAARLEFDHVAIKVKHERTLAEPSLASHRRAGDSAVIAAESRLRSARTAREIAEKSLVSARGHIAENVAEMEKFQKKFAETQMEVAARQERLANAREAEKKAGTTGKRKEAEQARASAEKLLATAQGSRISAELRVKETMSKLVNSKMGEESLIKALADRSLSLDKAVVEVASVQKKAKEDIVAAEMKLAKVLADGDKLMTEAQAKLKRADSDKTVADKMLVEALMAADRALAEKNAILLSQVNAKLAAVKAEAEAKRRRDLFNAAKLSADQALAEKLVVEQLLARQEAAGGLPK